MTDLGSETCRRCAVHNDPNDYNVLVARDDEPCLGPSAWWGSLTLATWSTALPPLIWRLRSRTRCSGAGIHCRRQARWREGTTRSGRSRTRTIDTLFGLVTLRLCTSVAVAASQQAIRPEDPYLSISQEPIRAILPRLAGIHPRFATAALRAACGKSVLPSGGRVTAWLERPDCPTGSILGCDVSHSTTIDLSVGSPLVTGDPRDNEEPPLSARIEALMARREANVGIGRYGEARLLYSAPLFSSPEDRDGEHRTVHLGVDLFAPAGTAVLAPLDGVVHAVADNRAALDYGPVVILRHRTDAGDAFYTLYGHLGRASIEGLRPGQTISAGATIAALGTPAENGGWPPHLHFQIVLDLLDLSTDFPGVCRANEVDVWRALSPDPSGILRLPVGAQPFSPATGPPMHAQPARRICTNGAGAPSVET